MIALLVACVAPNPGPTPGPSAWEELAPLPIPAQEVAVLALDGEVWVLGGFDDALVPLDTVWVLDADGVWSSGPSLPRAVHHPNAAVLDGRIYMLGALQGLGFIATAEAWVHDPDAGGWTSISPVPEPVGASAVGVVGDEILLVGGLPGPHPRGWAYHPATDTWRSLPPLPEALDHAVGAGGSALHVVGGRRAGIGDVRDSVFTLDGSWAEVAPLPTARGGSAGAVLPDGRIVVAGGEGNPADPDGVYAEVEAYDPTQDAWETLPPLRTPRHGTGAAPWNGGLLVPGGATVRGFFAVDTVEWLPLELP